MKIILQKSSELVKSNYIKCNFRQLNFYFEYQRINISYSVRQKGKNTRTTRQTHCFTYLQSQQ